MRIGLLSTFPRSSRNLDVEEATWSGEIWTRKYVSIDFCFSSLLDVILIARMNFLFYCMLAAGIVIWLLLVVDRWCLLRMIGLFAASFSVWLTAWNRLAKLMCKSSLFCSRDLPRQGDPITGWSKHKAWLRSQEEEIFSRRVPILLFIRRSYFAKVCTDSVFALWATFAFCGYAKRAVFCFGKFWLVE